jgi:hypothetical protein
MNIPITSEDVESFFSLGLPKSGKARFESQEVINQMVSKEFKLVQRAVNAMRATLDPLEGRVLHAKEIAKTIAGRLLHPVTAPHEQEMVDWAQAQLDNQTHLDHWVKGEGFLMSPVYEDSVGMLFSNELQVADMNPELVLQGAKRMLEAAEIRNILPLVKELQYMVQGASVERARVIASAVKEEATRVMLAKYEMTAAEMYIALIQLQKQLALAPMANTKYSLIIDVPTRSFSDGTHIRLWKALGGLAQKPKQLAEPPKVENAPSKEEYDPFGWFS